MKRFYKRASYVASFSGVVQRTMAVMAMLLIFTSHSFANGQEKFVKIDLNNQTFVNLVDEINKQSDYTLIYKDADVKSESTLESINLKMEGSVKDILSEVLKSTNLTFTFEDNSVVIKQQPRSVSVATAQTQDDRISVSGKVLGEGGEPISGATILVEGTTEGAITDAEGAFILKAKVGDKLNVSYVGYLETTVAVSGAVMNITLQVDEMQVEDVVVTGYFNRNKATYTGNATTFTGEELKTISSGNVLSSLAMIDPSFKMNINNEFGSDPNRIPDFTIQGSTNLQNEYSNTPNMPTFILDGFEVTSQTIFDLDPNRVKSITILKDAAATAIYGSRADNGVVVVETVQPKEGEIRVTYNFTGEFSAADLSSYNLMNASEKLQYEVMAGVYTHINDYAPAQQDLDKLYNERLALVQSGIDTDWITKPVNSLGFGQKHSVIVEGGTKSLRYSVDVNYRNDKGVMKESGRDNIGISSKLQYANKKFKFSNILSFDNTKAYNSPYGDFSMYTQLNPYYQPYDADGNLIYQMYNSTGNTTVDVYNPLYNATIGVKDEERINNFTEMLSVEWDAMENLKFKANASIAVGNSHDDYFLPNSHTSFANNTSDELKGLYEYSNTQTTTYDINASANYTLQKDKHLFNAVAIYNVREGKSDTRGYSAWNFPNDSFDHPSMATEYEESDSPYGGEDITRLMGFAVNANYSYDSRFLFDVSLRSDASSVFGANKRWGTFYALGAGWNIHNEKWFENTTNVNLLKLRVSQGTTGGQNFNPYQAMKMFTYKQNLIEGTHYNDAVGALVMAYGNPDLKWQTTEKFNVGVDFSLFHNRLSGYVNYYNNVTRDKLIDFTLAPSTGYSTFTSNLGNVLNRGFEANLKGNIYRNNRNNIKIDVFANIVSNTNKLLDINNALTAFNDAQDDFATSEDNTEVKPLVKYIEGQSVNMIWAVQSLGIDPATGNEIFLDKDGNRTDVYDVANEVPIASMDPDFEGNFGLMATYKDFSMNAYFQYSYGGYIYNQTLVNKIENVNPQFNGDKRILYDRWQTAGDISPYKKISDLSTTYPTSRFVEQENYIRFSSISLSYQLSREYLKKWGIEMLRVTAIGNDLFTASTVKMERGTIYPFARNFSLNLQVTF